MILAAKLGLGVLGAALVLGGIVSSEGFVHVRVEEKRPGGTHIWLVVPAMAAPIALRLVPRRRIRRALSSASRWLPAATVAASQLEYCPDGTLVQVTDPVERVNVSKLDGSLVVDVNDSRETVHVAVPLEALSNSLQILAARAAPR